jgi:hypothetical protein
VSRALLSLATLGAVVTLVAVFAAGAPRARAADIFVLFLGALVMTGLLRWTLRVSGAGRPSRYERSLRRPPPRESARPAALERTERIVALAADNAFDLRHRLRPRLEAIAAHRLAAHRGLSLDSAEADTLLGDELAELFRSGPPQSGDLFAPGMPLDRQRAAIERLEQI